LTDLIQSTKYGLKNNEDIGLNKNILIAVSIAGGQTNQVDG